MENRMAGEPGKLTIEDVARYPRPGQAGPKKWKFSPDCKKVNYLSNAPGSLVQQLWAYDIEQGRHIQLTGGDAQAATEAPTFSREEELRRERSRTREIGITNYDYAMQTEPPVMLVPVDGGLSVRKGEGLIVPLPGSEGAIAPQLSPDGKYVAYVRDGELQV